MSTAHEVFISYSWDSEAHIQRVLAFAQELRSDGIDAWVDKFDMPSVPWPMWCHQQLRDAQHVLVVCTATYERRALREDSPGSGRGVTWEGAIISHELYDETAGQTKYIPVVFTEADLARVPFFLRGYSVYDLGRPTGFDEVVQRLAGRPPVQPAELGARPAGSMRQQELAQLPRRVLEVPLPVGEGISQQEQSHLVGDWVVDSFYPTGAVRTFFRLWNVQGERLFESRRSPMDVHPTATGQWTYVPAMNQLVIQGQELTPYGWSPFEDYCTFTGGDWSSLKGVGADGATLHWQRA